MKAAYVLSLLTLALAAPKNGELTLNDLSDIIDVSDPVIQSAWESAVSFTETSDLEAREEPALEVRAACKNRKQWGLCVAICNTGCAVGCRCGSCFQICPKSCDGGKWGKCS
ncbi:hypothetical protein FDECE_7291 [Fusarium decemcellulare]|nr:hypothetical protein FDECE_7291 [Fusarium decemcellulare]